MLYSILPVECVSGRGKFPISTSISGSLWRKRLAWIMYRDLSTLAWFSPGLLIIPCFLKRLLDSALSYPSQQQISI